MSETRMPVAFLGHGNPMNALADNRYTRAWQAFGRAAPKPKAILVISAHWYTNATAVTAMVRPRIIHDFYGFPQDAPLGEGNVVGISLAMPSVRYDRENVATWVEELEACVRAIVRSVSGHGLAARTISSHSA